MMSGLSSLGGSDECPSVGDLTNDVAVFRQQLFERAEQERVIVSEQDARSTLSPHDPYGTRRRRRLQCRIGMT